jgi:hypothetical protein
MLYESPPRYRTRRIRLPASHGLAPRGREPIASYQRTLRPTERPALRRSRLPGCFSPRQPGQNWPPVPTGVAIAMIGSLTGDLVIVGSGITLICLVAMAAPQRRSRTPTPIGCESGA